MEYFEIIGGNSLCGEVTIQGAKNEALPCIAAVLLTDRPVTIYNIPEISDVLNLIGLIKELGVEVLRIDKNAYTFKAETLFLDYLKTPECAKKSSALRGSLTLVGPLLARFKKSYLLKPGGDQIGRRRVDTHLLGLQELNVYFKYVAKNNYYELSTRQLRGNTVLLEEPSVTGTANVLTAAVMASGITTIYNAACEPYIQQLCRMLVSMGAKIEGIGSNLLRIEGVDILTGTTHTILPDMVEAGSFIGLAAMTDSELTLKNIRPQHLGIIPRKFQQLGIKCKFNDNDLVIPKQGTYEIQSFLDNSVLILYDHPWPGLTPDLLSIMLIVATQARGSVLIHQKMFESRLFFVDKLIDMGAQVILCDPHRATVIGLERKRPLIGITMSSPDIRAGIALLIAALSAEGKSKIYNIRQIDRGYENIELKLHKLGAKIRRVPVS